VPFLFDFDDGGRALEDKPYASVPTREDGAELQPELGWRVFERTLSTRCSSHWLLPYPCRGLHADEQASECTRSRGTARRGAGRRRRPGVVWARKLYAEQAERRGVRVWSKEEWPLDPAHCVVEEIWLGLCCHFG